MRMEYLMLLMTDPLMVRCAEKAARRYTKNTLDREEYVSDAWVRLAELPSDRTAEFYQEHIEKAIRASYQRKRDRGQSYVKKSLNGISREPKKIPRDAVSLGRGRWLRTEAETLDGWYYHGEWEEYGLNKGDLHGFQFYEIVVVD